MRRTIQIPLLLLLKSILLLLLLLGLLTDHSLSPKLAIGQSLTEDLGDNSILLLRSDHTRLDTAKSLLHRKDSLGEVLGGSSHLSLGSITLTHALGRWVTREDNQLGHVKLQTLDVVLEGT